MLNHLPARTCNLPCIPSSGGQFGQQQVVVVNDRKRL